MGPREGSDSGRELKSADDGKNEEGSDYNSSENYDGKKEAGQGQKGQTDVPADEMLSDDYYEQDGEDQSDSRHYRGLNNSNTVRSRPQARPVAVSNKVSSSLKASKYKEYDDDDNDKNDDDDAATDVDYEDDDEEDEDDPDDVDFEPDSGVTSGRTGNKDKGRDGEDSDEADESDDDLDILDDDDAYYTKNLCGLRNLVV